MAHRHVTVDDIRIFYREAGPADAPVVLLLHGFPSASHQFRRLIDTLAGRYRLIAPDYPGFGHSDAPTPASIGGPMTYSFDRLAELIEGFCQELSLDRFFMYVFDFGAPVGFRVATRHPDWIAGLVVQNANAYEQGLSSAARQFVAARPGVDGAEQQIRELFTLSATRHQYLAGTDDADAVAPDGWILDQHFLELPDRKQIQLDLAFDYHTNVELYPEWQAWLRRYRPPTLVVWGRNDPFFVEAGAHAFAQDVPDAEVHLFDTGHFALEEKLPEIAPLIAGFLDRTNRRADNPLKIAVVGASGHIGRAVAQEALSRGHQVTAIARDVSRLDGLADATFAEADVVAPASIQAAVADHDAVVAAVRGRDASELPTVPTAAKVLLDVLPRAGVDRLLFVGGGSSLEFAPGRRFVDAPEFPQHYKDEALAQADALATLRTSGDAVDWSYASPPPAHLVDGDRTGRYRARAGDQPVVDDHGDSRITVADYAAAIIDALETRDFVHQRFTVGY